MMSNQSISRPDGLSVAEKLFAGYACEERDLLVILVGSTEKAERLLKNFPTLYEMGNASIQDLIIGGDLTKGQATKLKAAIEFGRLMLRKPLTKGAKFTCSQDVFAAYGPLCKGRNQEIFWVLLLDQRNRVMQQVQVSEGTQGSCPVHPRDVLGPALKAGAASMILLHNHPSGDPDSSLEDRELTERLRKAAELVGIRILDHIIIGGDCYESMADRGTL
jgi:DNA repair protein RadC